LAFFKKKSGNIYLGDLKKKSILAAMFANQS
jgi:hypothetical protein